MPTEPLTSRVLKSRGDARVVQYDQYIDTQVEHTRRMVKAVDLATSLVVMTTAVLAFLLAAAVVEHWLVPGGYPFAVRATLFALLAGGIIYFAYRRLWPLLIRAINPVYAAQTIESSAASGSSLKNSLVNLLLFRQRRSEISDAVYRTLEEQAAQRLSRVPIDGTVDRSLLIRFGYVLLAVVAVAALYKVLSPKDPLVSAQRVLMPWAEVVPASRVRILAVEPGAVTVSRGEFLKVSADVRGLDDDEPVLLRYTTADGRAINKPVPMTADENGLRFEARLPEQRESAGPVGIAQNLKYRIEAGDARSLDYPVTVVPAPSILVERVKYEYPPYTGYSMSEVEGVGDIRAIEGTRVTITARANAPINEAHVDFDADGRRDLRMTAKETSATASFVLALREDRQTPKHASYVLRFTNREGRANRDPVKHSIAVEPDLPPEVAILLPQERAIDVRLDETLAIEVEARDPDFMLADVRLRGEVAGRGVLDEALLTREHRGRFTSRYSFTPSAHDLRAGDVVEYWVTANDNRTPQPNVAESERKRIRILSPDPPKQPPPDQVAQRDPQQREQPGEQQQGEQQQGEQQPNGQQQGEPQQGQEGGEGRDGQPGAQQPGAAARDGEQQPQDGQQQDQPGDQEFSRDAERSADERQADTEKGKQGERAPRNGQDQKNQDTKPGEQQPQDGQPDAGGQNGQGADQVAQSDGGQADGKQRPSAGEGQNRARQAPGEPNDQQGEPSPVSSEGDNDAEAFERIQRHLERSGDLKDAESSSAENQNEFSRDPQRSAEQRPGDKESGRQDDGEAASAAGEEDAQTGEQPAEQAKRQTKDGKGPGAETKGDDLEPRPEQQPGDEQAAQDAERTPGGEQTSSKGPSGAGEEEQPQGAPNSQPEMKPGEKRQQERAADQQTDSTEPSAGARGKKESDSQGEQSGDKSGGGEEGGGQKAPREGTGSAGENQAADEGAGESSEKGGGADSRDPGSDAKADDRTGQSEGETPGRGSKVREGEGQKNAGKEQSGDEDTRAPSPPGEEQQQPREQQPFSRDAQPSADGESASADGQRDAKDRTTPSGAPTGGGGEQGSTAGAPRTGEGEVPAADPANLEYARKQTDLVLEKLSDQLNRKRVDERLLEDLGWSEEDLRKFIERWKSRKAAANRDDAEGEAARRELDEALRSLGLRRGPLRQGPVKEDTLRDLREGYRGPVPAEYQERLRAYNRGVLRANDE